MKTRRRMLEEIAKLGATEEVSDIVLNYLEEIEGKLGIASRMLGNVSITTLEEIENAYDILSEIADKLY